MSAVFFYTAPFCRATYQWITPIFDELREQFPHITMFKVIMEQNRPGPTVDVFGVHRNMNTGSTLDELGIQETPTFHCYLKLERVHEVAGISARHLKKRLENVYKPFQMKGSINIYKLTCMPMRRVEPRTAPGNRQSPNHCTVVPILTLLILSFFFFFLNGC
ncbi:uncharacterized protein LOC117635808 [Prunus dulcis]|uniref:uncharacterized protein LOC117635808 n=1 Tax=Prunus dulcis TaxID=3755 RepID=UPI0014828B62|nr:uncharacterized protein LOC117635808 [Prunus dulcis]